MLKNKYFYQVAIPFEVIVLLYKEPDSLSIYIVDQNLIVIKYQPQLLSAPVLRSTVAPLTVSSAHPKLAFGQHCLTKRIKPNSKIPRTKPQYI